MNGVLCVLSCCSITSIFYDGFISQCADILQQKAKHTLCVFVKKNPTMTLPSLQGVNKHNMMRSHCYLVCYVIWCVILLKNPKLRNDWNISTDVTVGTCISKAIVQIHDKNLWLTRFMIKEEPGQNPAGAQLYRPAPANADTRTRPRGFVSSRNEKKRNHGCYFGSCAFIFIPIFHFNIFHPHFSFTC